MPMFTICTAIIPDGELEKQVSGFREAEKRFTREIGVLQRDFYQCIQQPHIIWRARYFPLIYVVAHCVRTSTRL